LPPEEGRVSDFPDFFDTLGDARGPKRPVTLAAGPDRPAVRNPKSAIPNRKIC
jgi:hypothetical protein